MGFWTETGAALGRDPKEGLDLSCKSRTSEEEHQVMLQPEAASCGMQRL